MSPLEAKTLITALAALSQSIVQLDANVVYLARTYSGGAATNPAPPVDVAARPVAQPVKPQAQPISAADADMRREQREFNSLLRKLLTDIAARRSGAARGGYSGRDIGRPRSGPMRPERGPGRNFDGLVADRGIKSGLRNLRGRAQSLGVGRPPQARGRRLGTHDRKAAARLGRAAGGGVTSIVGALTLPLQKILGLLTPMSLMAQAINSSASGFQIFSSAVKVLAATFAPLLLPLFAVLAEGLIALSDKIASDLMPQLEEFYGVVESELVPITYLLVDTFAFAVSAMGDAARIVGDLRSNDPGRIMNRLNPFQDDFERDGTESNLGLSAYARTQTTRNTTARDDVIKELRMSMGPRASLSGIAQAGRNVQLAALNASPFEQRILDRFNSAVTNLERIRDNTTPRAGGRYESGDAGGDF